MKHILGIDPGLDGGFVMIDDDGKIVHQSIMPVIKLESIKAKKKSIKKVLDLQGIDKLLRELNPTMAYLEWVSARPGNGNVSMFNFGCGFGALEMGLVATATPYVLVRPQTWSKVMHLGISKNIDAKDRSLMVFKRSYPGINLRASDRCTTVHSGMLDALLIAEYGRRL